VNLASDSGKLVLTYACTEVGPELLGSGAVDLVRNVVVAEAAEHILAPTNSLAQTSAATAVRQARQAEDMPALEQAVASYVCTHGHPPTRPPRFPETGSQPPDFELSPMSPDEERGASMRLSELRGRVVVLVFWSTWCPACREEYQELQALSRRGRTEPVSTYIILHGDTRASLHRWQREHGAEVLVIEDEGERIARLYGVYGIPHTVVIRPDGLIHASGHVNPKELQRVVDEALRSTKVGPA